MRWAAHQNDSVAFRNTQAAQGVVLISDVRHAAAANYKAKADLLQASLGYFLYFCRHTEFIVRRCFFPYALLFFALFNIMNVAFVLSAIGANLVWPIALYSSHTFARGRSAAQEIPAASAEASASVRQYAPAQP